MSIRDDVRAELADLDHLRDVLARLLPPPTAEEAERRQRISKWLATVPLRFNPTKACHPCACGHVYARHFDSYENNAPVGCKYCPCTTFQEVGDGDTAGGVQQ